MSRFAATRPISTASRSMPISNGAGRGLPRRQALNRTGINANSRRALDSGDGVSTVRAIPNTRKIRASFRIFPAAAAREPERGADRLAPADAARRHDPAVERRHLFLAAARVCACCKKVEQIVREEQDRAGAQEILMPTIQPAELWRESGRYEDYGKEMLRITRPARARDAVRADQRGAGHRDRPRRDQELSRPAEEPLPHPVEVPRRGAAALRRHARARIPDEGRLQLRPRRQGGASTPTTRCSSPICAPSRAWG